MDRRRTGVLLRLEEKPPPETMCGGLLAGTVRAVRRLENPLTRARLRIATGSSRRSGLEVFAERTRRELPATGEHVLRRTLETRDDLTAQERQVALVARDGMSNMEIGARLFLSRQTAD